MQVEIRNVKVFLHNFCDYRSQKEKTQGEIIFEQEHQKKISYSINQFLNYLIFFNQPKQYLEFSTKSKEYLNTIKPEIKSLLQQQFEEQNQQAIDLYEYKSFVPNEFNQTLDDLIK
ncbi:unnamed protein product [Paramecium primaurelia]|uniref:Uncharacterized protein n=1 Tax=Paramecium primaurelia TaxID=5886 RepID=A0A8S1MP86_PARPR|nr:unnamed protein product [Paramecium primaurelia]